MEPDWTGRCRCLQTFGMSRIAASRRSRRAVDAGSQTGSGRCPSTGATASRRPAKSQTGRPAPGSDSRSARAAAPRGARSSAACRTSARMSAFGRIRSCPRVYGTTQKLQYSLQPSMIVTHARTGSLRRVTPNGNATSSFGAEVDLRVRRSGSACATSIGSIRTRRVPTMTSTTAGAFEQRRALLLRDAAGDGDNGIVPRLGPSMPQLTEPRVELLFGALPHAAGVDDDDVRVALVVRALVARRLEQAGHLLRVVVVHLAAEGLDQVSAAHCSAFRLAAFAFAFRLRFAFAPSAAGEQFARAGEDSRGDRRRRPSCGRVPRSGRRPSSPLTDVTVRPPRTCLLTWKCVSPHAAICGRCVMHSTWASAPGLELPPHIVGGPPPMPASTSSKIEVCRGRSRSPTERWRSASMTARAPRPRRCGPAGGGPRRGSARRRNSAGRCRARSTPISGSGDSLNRTSKRVRAIASSASAPSSAGANRSRPLGAGRRERSAARPGTRRARLPALRRTSVGTLVRPRERVEIAGAASRSAPGRPPASDRTCASGGRAAPGDLRLPAAAPATRRCSSA